MSDTSEPQKCFNKREDYMECLHHRKEVRPNTLPQGAARYAAHGSGGRLPTIVHTPSLQSISTVQHL